MSPGSWFGWVLIGGGVFAVVFLFVLSMCWAASEGDDVAGEVFARHEGVVAGVPSAPATTPDEFDGIVAGFYPGEDAAAVRTQLTKDDPDA